VGWVQIGRGTFKSGQLCTEGSVLFVVLLPIIGKLAYTFGAAA